MQFPERVPSVDCAERGRYGGRLTVAIDAEAFATRAPIRSSS